MGYGEQRTWLEDVVGPADVDDVPDHAGDYALFDKTASFMSDLHEGGRLEYIKDDLKAKLAGVRLKGKGVDVKILEDKVLTRFGNPKSDIEGGEYDSHADHGDDLRQIISGGKKLDLKSPEAAAVIAEMGASYALLMKMSTDMQNALGMQDVLRMPDGQDKDREIKRINRIVAKEIWDPMVREGAVPSNFVPDKFSQTVQVFDAGARLYEQLSKREEGRSMGRDRKGRALSIAKFAVKVAKTAGQEIINWVDHDIVEASREDIAKFMSVKHGIKVDDDTLDKVEKLRELETADPPEGMSEAEVEEWREAEIEKEFGDEADDIKLMSDDMAKLENLAGDDFEDLDGNGLDDSLEDRNSIRPIDVIMGNFEEAKEGDPPFEGDYDDWLDSEEARIEAEMEALSEGGLTPEEEIRMAELNQELDSIQGAQLMNKFGEHQQHEAFLKIASSAATGAIEVAQKRHERKARRDVGESFMKGMTGMFAGLFTAVDVEAGIEVDVDITDAIKGLTKAAITGDRSHLEAPDIDIDLPVDAELRDGTDRTLDTDARDDDHKAKYAEQAANAFLAAGNKLSQAIHPSKKGDKKTVRELLVGALDDFLVAGGATVAALGQQDGGILGIDSDGAAVEGGQGIDRDEGAEIAMYSKATGAVARALDRMVAALQKGDKKAFFAELGVALSGGPAAAMAGQIGDLTRADVELGDIEGGMGAPGDGKFATNPFEEVRGAGGQTGFGMSGDMATIADQRAGIEDTIDLLNEVHDASDALYKKKLAKKLEKARATVEALAPEDERSRLLQALSLDATGEINKDSLETALAMVQRMVRDAAGAQRVAGQEFDNALVDQLGAGVDKDALKADLDSLGDLVEQYDPRAPRDDARDAAALEAFRQVEKNLLKDDRVIADIQDELDDDQRELDALMRRADLSTLDLIDDETKRVKAGDAAVDAIETLTRKLHEAERNAKLMDQASKGLCTVLAAVPGAGLALKVRNLIANTIKAQKRLNHLRTWKRQMEAMRGNYSIYERAAKSERDHLQAAHAHDGVTVLADTMAVSAEAMRLFDQTHIGAAVARTGEKSTRILNDLWYGIYTELTIKNGWKAFEKARDDRKDRRAARTAVGLNTTLAKCVLAYGACIDKDSQARAAVTACGLTPEKLESKTDVCHAVIDYMRAFIMDDEFEVIADHGGGDWMPCKAEADALKWMKILAAARKLKPPISAKSFDTPDIIAGLDAFQEAIDSGNLVQIRASSNVLIRAIQAYRPTDDKNRPHNRMEVATQQLLIAVKEKARAEVDRLDPQVQARAAEDDAGQDQQDQDQDEDEDDEVEEEV